MILSGRDCDITSETIIYIWGIGINEEIFNREYTTYFQDMGLLGINGDNLIMGYVQSSPSTTCWRGKEVLSPNILTERKVDLCVITPKENGEIKKWLDNHNINWILAEDFFDVLISSIINKAKNDYVTSTSSILDEMFVEVFSFICRWKETGFVNQAEFEKLSQKYTLENMVAYLSRYYKNNISEIDFLLPSVRVKRIKTVGLYVERLYGGGIEKVVELLTNLFLQNGYQITLITDEWNPDAEPPIYRKMPIVRYSMKTAKGGDCFQRCKELAKVIDRNAVDIMCYHAGYNRINTFYEMLYLRMKRVPVVMELHSSFATLQELPQSIFCNLRKMYYIPNQVVVLSEKDKRYWEDQKCKCVYIPNPISLDSTVKRKSNGKTILWVGRIVQDPKQVLDVPEIAKIVRRYIPDVCFVIIGVKEKEYDYNLLIKKIEDYGLEDRIIVKEYRNDISEEYNKADVVLLTSDKESFSNVIIESRYFGVPLVMYKIPWLELTKDKRGIVEVPQKDIKSAAERIVEIIMDRELNVKMSVEAKKSAEEYQSIDVIGKWKELFETI